MEGGKIKNHPSNSSCFDLIFLQQLQTPKTAAYDYQSQSSGFWTQLA
jgi:hypothetical protein